VSPVYIDDFSAYLGADCDRDSTLAILRGEQPAPETDKVDFKPSLLPPNERRRASESVRLAFSVCEALYFALPEDARDLPSVFASSGGDYRIFDTVCRSLLEQQRQISPTLFHNSVHNAAAGYWSIASAARSASSSIAAGDFTVAMGLLEAMAQCLSAPGRCLLACYDICPPAPLNQVRPISRPFAFGLILNAQRSAASRARLTLRFDKSSESESTIAAEFLRSAFASNPIARGLDLLSALALRTSATLTVPASAGQNLELSLECLS